MKIILSIVFVLLGVLCIYIGIKLLQSQEKIRSFHQKVEEEYRPQIAELNETVDDVYGNLESLNKVFEMTDRVFTKLLSIFFKKHKHRHRI